MISSILPLSILDIFSTSLINFKRCPDACSIFPRQSITRSGSPIFSEAIRVIPIIAFIGVRISWDIFDKKILFARLARSACSWANSIASFNCSCCFLTVSISRTLKTTTWGEPFFSSAITNCRRIQR